MQTKVLIPTDKQELQIQQALAHDRNCNFGSLEYYLKQIIINRDVTFTLIGGDELTLPAREAWRIIGTWAQGEGNLPVGDRPALIDIRRRATGLLNYIQTNISGKTAEAAGSYHLILEQARHPAKVVPATGASTQEVNLQKVFDLRRKQIELLESKFLSPLASKLSQSKFLAGIPDAETRALAIQMIAAGNANFRYPPPPEKKGYENFTAEKVHQLLLHSPGLRDFNSVMRLVYAKSATEDFTNLSRIINETIGEVYGGSEAAYQKDMSSLRSLSSLSPSLDSIASLVKNADVPAEPEETEALIRSIRRTVIASARGEHVDGRQLLLSALKSAGFSEISIDHFTKLVPYIEEIQIQQRHLLLGSELTDSDSRLLATSGLAAELGVDLTTPWIKAKELNAITERAISPTAQELYQVIPDKLKDKKTLSLQEAFDFEYAKGSKADPHKLAEFTNLMSKHKDFELYHKSVDGNFSYQFQEFWSKGMGNYLAIRQPIDRFSEKVWGHIENIDDIIHGPQRGLANWWDRQQEEHPWLNPGALIANKWVGYQSSIALKVHAWALNLSTTTSAAWIKSFAGHITDFTEGFVKHEASWSGASSFFVSRKIGNTLDWATKFATKGKHGTFTSLRFAIANKAWNGFAKLAPNLSGKMVASGLNKAIIAIIGGEMTMGVSVAIQIAWEVVKFGFGFIKKIFTDKQFQEKFLRALPLLVGGAVTSASIFLAGVPMAIVAGAGIVGGAVLTLLQGAILSLAPLFALAATVAFSVVAFFTIVWYGLINPTFQLDAGTSLQEMVSDIVCNLTESTAPSGSSNPKLAAGKCLVELLTEFGLNPLNKGNATGANFLAFAASLGNSFAASEAARSATQYLAFQCVGFDVVVDIMTGGQGGFTQANLLDTIPPPGYTYVTGVGSCSPGDYFVDNGGAFGHTGLFVSVEGANIVCMDANSDSRGLVRDDSTCRWPTSKIAGCLKKK